MAGGCKEEEASASLPFFPFTNWQQETLGFLAPGAWKMVGERGRRERETWEKELFITWLFQTYTSTCIYKHRVK